MPQSLRDGRYVLMGTLGEGSQGHTFDGVDAREGRPVAIKRFDVRGAATWKDVELAEREARVLQSLSHSHLPRYVDHFEENGALYLVMEKIEGESLAALRKRGGSLDEAGIVRLLRDASGVLDYLHGRAPSVIHRDLKPGNVIRRTDGSFAFVDFGAVRDKLRPEGGSTVVGTFGFMAPEQFQGRALPGSDVYALGATAVAMMTGRDPEDLPHKGLTLDVRAALAGRASDRLVTVLEQMLEPDPDRRARSVAALLARLEGRSSRNRARGTPGPTEPWDAWRQTFERDMERWSARFERKPLEAMKDLPGLTHAMRQARRNERQARREARRREHARRRGLRVVPWPVSFVLAVLFTLAIVAVSVATQVVVPVVLLVLSVVFGRALREAANSVRQAGREAIEGIHQSRRWLGGQRASATDSAPPVRVASETGAKAQEEVRVATEERAGPGDEEDEGWEESPRRERR